MKQISNGFKKTFRVCLYVCLLTVIMSCNEGGGVSLSLFNDSETIDSEAFYQGLLEQFCRDNYDDLFRDFWGTREYVHNSLTVDSIRPCGEREVIVYGKHCFVGRTDRFRKDYLFKSNVYESKKTPHDYIVTFEKESKRLITKKSYYESRTKNFHYEK